MSSLEYVQAVREERRSPKNKNAASADWTAARCAQLAELWATGASSRQIAEEMGGISRCAVIGKAHRMKLPGRKTVHPKTNARYRGKPSAARKPRVKVAFRPGAQLPILPEMLPGDLEALKGDVWAALPDTTPKPLLAVSEDNGCRWPIGEERPYLFCGEPIHKGVYCAAHYAVSYRPVPVPPKRPVRVARGVNIRDFEEA